MSEPTKELIDALFHDKIRSARQMSPGDRLLDGPRLFDYACEITKAGIRAQNPHADEQRVMEILRARLALARRLEAGA